MAAKKKVLVCGATGFIGRNLVESLALRPEYQVYGVVNKRPPYKVDGVEFVKADLTQAHDVKRVIDGMDIVIQAAAVTSGSGQVFANPWIHVTDNAVMNSLIFRTAHDCKVKHVVFFSCTVMYHSSETPLKESDFDANRELEPRYFGAASTKLYLEKVCEFFSRLNQTKFTVLRHSNMYGPYDKYDLDRSHFFGATVTKVMTNTDGKIGVWGDGSEKRDLLYISDLVDCVEASLQNQNESFGLYNVGVGKSLSVREVVEKIIKASGKKIDMEFDLSKPTIKTNITLNTDLVFEKLGWKPTITLDDGIKKTLDWYKSNTASQTPVKVL